MIAVVYFLLLSTSWADNPGPCGQWVTSRQTQDHTEGLIALFEDLLERQIIGATHLNRLVRNLEKSQILNPILESETWTSSRALIHYHAIVKYLGQGQLKQQRILEWSRAQLNKFRQISELKSVARQKTTTPIYKMEFNPVEGKAFEMGINGRKWKIGDNGVSESVPVNLTHTFELMSTHVTESMWAELIGNGSSVMESSSYSENAIPVEIDGKIIQLRPNHPVGISWLSAAHYSNRLSILKGLTPAYDLSDIVYEYGTSLEKGNLRAQKGEVRINAPNGDIYQAEGYRLPTEAEYAFVVQLGGPPDKTYPFGNDDRELVNYEWYQKNSGDRLHAVAELAAYIFDGNSFYDLIGNISHWMHDFESREQQGGNNPQGPKDGQTHVGRGGNYRRYTNQMNSYIRSDMASPATLRGFRLARTIKYASPGGDLK